MSSMEESFKRISRLIDSGKAPNEAADMYSKDDEEERKKKKFLNKDKTERFMESFGS